MPFSKVEDLLLGDILVSQHVDKQSFVDEAANEMLAKLGFIYALPLAPVGTDPVTDESWLELPMHEVLTLKTINNRLASGRLILTLDAAGEGTQLHAYGWSLVQEALGELMVLANQDVDLTAIKLTLTSSGQSDMSPSVRNHDEESLLLGFENTVMRGVPWYSIPGEVR